MASAYRTIPVGKDQFATVDEADYGRVIKYQWRAVKYAKNRMPYVILSGFGGLRIFLHRFILMAPPAMRVDHHDGNPLNNRRENLRFCTSAQNTQNAVKSKANTSGFKGVCWNKHYKRWVAHIGYQSKVIYLGGFKDPVSAARTYDHAARRYHGPFARLNFPKPGEQKA